MGLDSFENYMRIRDSMKMAIRQTIYPELCEKLQRLRERLRYPSGRIMRLDGLKGYLFEKSFMQQFAYTVYQTDFMFPSLHPLERRRRH